MLQVLKTWAGNLNIGPRDNRATRSFSSGTGGPIGFQGGRGPQKEPSRRQDAKQRPMCESELGGQARPRKGQSTGLRGQTDWKEGSPSE